MSTWKFTTVHHPARRALKLDNNEYCVLDVYYQSQTHPQYSVDGWADISVRKLAAFFGLSVGGAQGIIKRMVARGFMEETGNLRRTTPMWYNHAYLEEDKIDFEIDEKTGSWKIIKLGVQKVNSKCSESEQGVQKVNGSVQKVNGSVQKVNAKCSESEHYNIIVNKLNNNSKLNSLFIEKSENEKISTSKTDHPNEKEDSAVNVTTLNKPTTRLAEAKLTDYLEKLQADQLFIENAGMRHRLKEKQIIAIAQGWGKERIMLEEFAQYPRYVDFRKHFFNWLNYQKPAEIQKRLNVSRSAGHTTDNAEEDIIEINGIPVKRSTFELYASESD